MSEIVDFLEGRGVDRAGRRLADVLGFSLQELEQHHDFIQWLFPLPEASRAVPGAPVLMGGDIIVLKASAQAQANLTNAAQLMGHFYDRTDHWMRADDHNHRRITRIIKSLRLLSGDRPADRFRAQILARVEQGRATVSPVSLSYWAAA